MSILTAIFQAIFQAICFIIPISESGHSAIFHDFSGRADGTVAALTGVIHIGIAVGIFLALLKLCLKLGGEFGKCAVDVAKKNFSYKEAKPIRKFLLMLMLSFAPMLLWLIPCGKGRLFFEVLRKTGFNGTLLDTGIFLALTGGLLFAAIKQLSLSKNDKAVTVVTALACGAASIVLLPVSGFAYIGGLFSLLVLLGVTRKTAYRFSFLMSIPVLIVMGIIELATAAYSVSAVQVIIALVLSVAVSFACVRAFKILLEKHFMQYVAYYDLFLGAIVAVIGIVQLIVR